MIDLSTVIQGPYGASMIADLGARVIKIDPTPERGSPRPIAQLGNLKTYAGKKCIQIDLQRKEGQDLLHKLIAKADVLLHNFRPGVPEPLGRWTTRPAAAVNRAWSTFTAEPMAPRVPITGARAPIPFRSPVWRRLASGRQGYAASYLSADEHGRDQKRLPKAYEGQ